MAQNPFFAALMNGNIRMPDAAINMNRGNPLPSLPPGATQFSTPDGQYNQHGLPIANFSPYAYAKPARISTQTQMAHPNRVALIIPKLYLPSPQSDISDPSDPVLEHCVSDGDLVFSFRMTPDMTCYGSQYFVAPYGYSSKAVPLINLATANYILWGLQVGMRLPRHTHWSKFFAKLMHNHPLLYNVEHLTLDHIWNFIRTYIRPLGVQHGGDMQGGRHEGDSDPIVTHGAVDYVSSFAIEGKLLHVNNLWRDFDVHEGDDLVLSLARMENSHSDVFFDLSSSTRSHRTERAPISNAWYYLRPTVLEYRSFSEMPYIHVGRSQKYCSLFSRGQDACCWNARMGVVPGAPLQLTFEPGFVQSDDMFYRDMELEEGVLDDHLSTNTRILKDNYRLNNLSGKPEDNFSVKESQLPPPPPPFHLNFSKRPEVVHVAAQVASGGDTTAQVVDDELAQTSKGGEEEAAPPPKAKKHKGISFLIK